ncbi:hypothetical protein PoB_007515600 [Plakobranchus ocellatus]|uniref:Reverse transcriptase n=1 Tax=Plakobranchus ocellatus TaxID=259542 RepID=A0AAV4DX22_9GAST|nr:hypothetical protein PoB_007515600 [Plakobranchus ocellatus]
MSSLLKGYRTRDAVSGETPIVIGSVSTTSLAVVDDDDEAIVAVSTVALNDHSDSTTVEDHLLELTSSTPVRHRPYPFRYAMKQTLRNELGVMGNLEIIRTSNSSYASSVVVVKKKGALNASVLTIVS